MQETETNDTQAMKKISHGEKLTDTSDRRQQKHINFIPFFDGDGKVLEKTLSLFYDRY